MDASKIDLPTLASLAALASNEHLLGRIHEAGHPAIRTSHGFIFQHLIEGSPTVGELAALLGLTQQAASKSILELESLGYVERTADPADSRIRRVALTAAGKSVIEKSRTARAKLEADIVREVGPAVVKAARTALVALLDRTGGLEAVTKRRVKPATE